MPVFVQVSSNQRAWLVHTSDELRGVLALSDSRGGGEFWLSRENSKFPCLVVRKSGNEADIHFFPYAGHPGFRRLSHRPEGSDAIFKFEGCSPYEGERVPWQFVVSVIEAVEVAMHFMEAGEIQEQSEWFEL